MQEHHLSISGEKKVGRLACKLEIGSFGVRLSCVGKDTETKIEGSARELAISPFAEVFRDVICNLVQNASAEWMPLPEWEWEWGALPEREPEDVLGKDFPKEVLKKLAQACRSEHWESLHSTLREIVSKFSPWKGFERGVVLKGEVGEAEVRLPSIHIKRRKTDVVEEESVSLWIPGAFSLWMREVKRIKS